MKVALPFAGLLLLAVHVTGAQHTLAIVAARASAIMHDGGIIFLFQLSSTRGDDGGNKRRCHVALF